MKKIFTTIDGRTSGPNLFSGPIGLQLPVCTTLPVQNFERIEVAREFIINLMVNEDLSSDQKYLRDIIISISDGCVTRTLANRSPGKLGYARWLTTANRILRIYVATEDPSANMKTICKYIIHVYARTWFAVKAQLEFHRSPTHLHNMVIYAREINDERISNVLQDKLNKNSYSLHSETMICAMLCDPRQSIRRKAVERIIKCRETPEIRIRKFVKPKVNMMADDYYLLIDQSKKWLEPVLTKDISDAVLQQYLHRNEVPIIPFDPYPSHTQSVERHIRLVSRCSQNVIDKNLRDSHINATLMHRKMFPKLSTKRDYYNLV